MSETKNPPTGQTDPSTEVRRSPVRPTLPPPQPPAPMPPTRAVHPTEPPPEPPTNSSSAMNTLRRKMELVADEFSQGKINRAQFHAVYKRYSEQRTIIERMVERNPETDAWKQVIGINGQTGFLRHHFEAQPLYYVVYRHHRHDPIMSGGKHPPNEGLLKPLLSRVWSMPSRPKLGLGRRAIDDEHWLILATGEHSATAVVFSLEPSIAQAVLVRDLHADFERANQAALARGWIVPDHMVFPQRALAESEL